MCRIFFPFLQLRNSIFSPVSVDPNWGRGETGGGGPNPGAGKPQSTADWQECNAPYLSTVFFIFSAGSLNQTGLKGLQKKGVKELRGGEHSLCLTAIFPNLPGSQKYPGFFQNFPPGFPQKWQIFLDVKMHSKIPIRYF